MWNGVAMRVGSARLIHVSMFNIPLAATLILAHAQAEPADATSVSEGGDVFEAWDEDDAQPPQPIVPTSTTDTVTKYEEPRFKGVGLLATTAGLGGSALVLTITRIGLMMKNCPMSESNPTCTYDIRSDLGLSASHWVLNAGAVGFAPGAGVLMGRYAAWKAANGTGPKRKPNVFIGTGAGLLGAGVAGLGAATALAFTSAKICTEKELESGDALAGDRCLKRAFPAWTLTNWASFSMISAGGALLGYGVAYKRAERTRYSFTVTPYGGFGMAGLAVSGSF